MEAVFHNVELGNGSHGITVGHPQMRHLVQRRTSDQHLRRLPGKLPRTYTRSEYRFHSKHLRLSQTSPMITDLLLPRLAAHLPDSAQVLISNQSLLLTIAMLPYLRISARRDGGPGFSFPDCLITVPLIVGAIAADLLNLIIDLLKQLFEHLAIGHIVGCHHSGNDLARGFIGTYVQFAPGASLRVAMLADFPFAFAKDFHARRIHYHVQRLIVVAAWQDDFQSGAAAAQGRVVGHRQIHAEQLDDRQQQALGGTQRQMVDLFERCHTQDGGVAIGIASTGFARLLLIVPDGEHIVTNPQRQASALNQSLVILFPVAETVALLSFLFLHKSRLPALPSPCFMQQSPFRGYSSLFCFCLERYPVLPF